MHDHCGRWRRLLAVGLMRRICTSIERNVLELLHDIEDEPAAAPRPTDVELPPDADVPIQSENALADIS